MASATKSSLGPAHKAGSVCVHVWCKGVTHAGDTKLGEFRELGTATKDVIESLSRLLKTILSKIIGNLEMHR